MPTPGGKETYSAGLVGFGLAGSVFHAPLIGAVPRLRLSKVSTSQVAAAEKFGLEPVASAASIIDDPAIDVVVIASPNHTHDALAEAALRSGKHVVVDKPLAASSEEADRLIALAAERGLTLTVFHNRRWDSDFLTVQELLGGERIGEVLLFEAFWDRFRPSVNDHWKEDARAGGGLLNDLGPHLIDQVLCLFGTPRAVTGDIGLQREGSAVDDYFDLRFDYDRLRVRLGASNLVTAPRSRFQLFGTQASFIKQGLDPQQSQLRDGLAPAAPGYGVEPAEQLGILTERDGTAEPVRGTAGRWAHFYEQLVAALDGVGPVPVDPKDASRGLALIELARRSATEGRTLHVPAD
jgi:scyllo-inositol 2-dehydrogenase (NADP+)